MNILSFNSIFFRIILFSAMSIFSSGIAYSLTLYKWTDENGVVHYSDKQPDKKAEILKLPKRKNIIVEEEVVVEDEQLQLEEEIISEEIKLYWRNLALGIEEK